MDRIDLEIEGDEYWVEGSDFDDMLEAVKAISGQRYHAEDKLWILAGARGPNARPGGSPAPPPPAAAAPLADARKHPS